MDALIKTMLWVQTVRCLFRLLTDSFNTHWWITAVRLNELMWTQICDFDHPKSNISFNKTMTLWLAPVFTMQSELQLSEWFICTDCDFCDTSVKLLQKDSLIYWHWSICPSVCLNKSILLFLLYEQTNKQSKYVQLLLNQCILQFSVHLVHNTWCFCCDLTVMAGVWRVNTDLHRKLGWAPSAFLLLEVMKQQNNWAEITFSQSEIKQ